MSRSQSLQTALDIAVAAGREILAVYHDQRQPEVSLKADDSPLTDADRRAHRLITTRLAEATPEIPVLSEESDAVDPQTRLGWPRYWLVDPLDGTKEFVKRNGEFTVNIALVEHGVPVLGVVHVPVTDVSYFGADELGSFRQEAGGEPQAIACRPLTRERRLEVVASRSHRDARLDKVLAALEQHFPGLDVVSMGSSLKICLVAEGRADLYPRLAPTCEWDTAAAHAVLAAAGGEIVDTSFNPLRYNRRDTLLNPHFIALGDPSFAWGDLLLPLLDD
ncbi:MAG: 3'(2'),5'-bisphosphate nucleotidase CysQ [Pseudohongiellaceae bacterium]